MILYRMNNDPFKFEVDSVEAIYAEHSLICVKLKNGDIEYGYMIKTV